MSIGIKNRLTELERNIGRPDDHCPGCGQPPALVFQPDPDAARMVCNCGTELPEPLAQRLRASAVKVIAGLAPGEL